MPATPPYIPQTDAALDSWATNFDTVITAAPTSYGLTAGQATTYNGLRTAYTSALATALAPATRTKPSVAAKDAAKAGLVALSRAYAAICQAFPSVTPELLADAGLTVRNTVPTPIPAPVTFPILSVISAVGGLLQVAFADELTPSAKYKPFGVIGLQVFGKTGATPPASIADCLLLGQVGRWPARIDISNLAAGTELHLIGRWITRRGLVGPVSATVSTFVA